MMTEPGITCAFGKTGVWRYTSLTFRLIPANILFILSLEQKLHKHLIMTDRQASLKVVSLDHIKYELHVYAKVRLLMQK
jgi:hypothetical protein